MRRARGICYVANTKGYCDEALNALTSLRAHMGSIPVAVVTNKELFRSDSRVTDWIELPPGRDGPIIKTAARLAPYDRVLYLDTDTFVLGDLSGLFDILDAFDLAATVDVTRGYDYGYNIPPAFAELNLGVVAFRNSAPVAALFKTWVKENDRLCQKLSVKVLNDQASFRLALWKSTRVRYAALASEYNFLGWVPGNPVGRVQLVHARGRKTPDIAKEVNREEFPRAFVPGLGTISSFRGRRLWLAQFVRLSWRFLKVMLRPQIIQGGAAPVDWAQESEAEAATKRRSLLP